MLQYIYAAGEDRSFSTEQFIQQYPTVFSEGVGRLDGQYHIRLYENITPVQHSPRRVPVPLRETLQQTLSNLTQ